MVIVETEGLQLALYEGVHDGELDVVVMRSALDDDTVQKLARAFDDAEKRERPGPAPGLEVGVHHYGRPIESYLRQVGDERERKTGVFSPAFRPLHDLQARMAKSFAERAGVDFRIARHGNTEASPAVVRRWTELGEYALRPHDDIAQLEDPGQRGFEIQAVADARMVATNVYLRVAGGGAVELWDVPSQMLRENRPFPGFPYDPADLSGRRLVEVGAGDIVALYGGIVHGVRASKERVVASFFSGHVGPGTIVYWA